MTSKVTIYHIPSKYIAHSPHHGDCCINIIDTPGFGDTRGPAWDKKIAAVIGDLLKNYLPSIDEICLVMKGTETRV